MSDQTDPLDEPRIPSPPEEMSGLVIEEAGPVSRFIGWAAGLPWWAIILVVGGVAVIYLMATSAAYQEVIRQWLTDDPKTTTYDLYDVVNVRLKPQTITGIYESETTDTPQDVVFQLLAEKVGSGAVVRQGFVEPPADPEIVIRIPAQTITIPRDQLLFPTDPAQLESAEVFSFRAPRPELPVPLFMAAGKSPIITVEGTVTEQSVYEITIETPQRRQNILKSRITRMEPPDPQPGDEVVVEYHDVENVTGTLVAQDDQTMTIRTQDEQTVTFRTDRMISMEPGLVFCGDDAAPDCEPREGTIIQRRGETLSGTLLSLTETLPRRLALRTASGARREFTLGDVEYYYLPTLTIAVNSQAAGEPVTPGDTLRIGYLEGTNLSEALADFGITDPVEVPLRYSEGGAEVELVAYPDVDALIEATASGEVEALIYIASEADRLAVQEWVEANPEGGLVLPVEPRECTSGCPVTVKLRDDTVSGIILNQTADEITVRTQPAQYIVLERDQIIAERSKTPGECALNNLRGCDEGIFLTLYVTFAAYALALVIGLFVALMRVSSNPILYHPATLYVEIVRGLPLLVILIYAGFVIVPPLREGGTINIGDLTIRFPGINISAKWSAIIGLAFGYGAFIAEIFRAGIQSIGRGQMEAARSLGMSYPQAMRYVILPQAIRVVLPPLGNDFIALLKDSALISVLALPDLLQKGRLFVSRSYNAFLGYSAVAVMYLFMTLFLSMLVRILERRTRLPS